MITLPDFSGHRRLLRVLPLILAALSVPGCAGLPPIPTAGVEPVAPLYALATDAASCEIGPERTGRAALPTIDPASIELLNWNIQKGGHEDWSLDLYEYGNRATVLTLQEAPLVNPGWEDGVVDGFHAFAPGFETRESPTGVMTVSTAVPLVQCNFAAQEPWLRTPKATLVTEYALTGLSETLLVVNIHAVNFTFGLGAFERQLAMASAILARHDGPVIFAGDFNTWRAARLEHLGDLVDAHGLAAVHFADDERKRVFGNPLDHVYIRGLDVVSAVTVETRSSDHNPMRVWLSVGS